GTGEGHRPWDLVPNSTMTNATVATEVASSNGKSLVLKYRDGEKTFAVPANVTVVTFAPTTEADLKPGEKVFTPAAKKVPDGTIEASNIAVGKNGLKPPMCAPDLNLLQVVAFAPIVLAMLVAGRPSTKHAFKHVGLAEPARDPAQFGLFGGDETE